MQQIIKSTKLRFHKNILIILTIFKILNNYERVILSPRFWQPLIKQLLDGDLSGCRRGDNYGPWLQHKLNHKIINLCVQNRIKFGGINHLIGLINTSKWRLLLMSGVYLHKRLFRSQLGSQGERGMGFEPKNSKHTIC